MRPFTINEDGTIDPIKKTATGLTGTASQITVPMAITFLTKSFVNTLLDADYPITGKALQVDFYKDGEESSWEINPGKSSKKDEYVSIESTTNRDFISRHRIRRTGVITPVLSQDVKGTTAEAESMTFRTLKGFNGSGVTFESVKYPGYYLTSKNGVLSMTQDPSDKDATFFVSTDTEIKSGKARKTKRMYTVGEELKTNDIRIQLYLETGKNG